jgi:Family of unknown function (DUF6519)
VRGDFSDVKFDSRNHFSRVLKQQGRVQLDSDDNEQTEIVLHYLRAFVDDLLRQPSGARSAACPASRRDSFKIDGASPTAGGFSDLTIQPGHYYVDGILCELEAEMSYTGQPDYPGATIPDSPFLVFLDVWERFVSAAEDDAIREVALGGPDTAGRSRVVWQVRAANVGGQVDCTKGLIKVLAALEPADRGALRVRAGREGPAGPCLVPPDARFRGEENQLYRVEIHDGGIAWDGTGQTREGVATFVWSRDNGSNAFPIASFEGEEVTLETLGRDTRTGLQEGDLVEVQYEALVLGDNLQPGTPPKLRNPPPLLEVKAIDRDAFRVTLDGDLGSVDDDLRATAKILRRWDRRPGAAADQSGTADDGSTFVVESNAENDGWLELENGIEIQFASDGGARYRSGDYWLVPARVATGDVRWPQESNGRPAAEPPDGVEHHYAPLAIVRAGDVRDCRTAFEVTLGSAVPP